ncbi:MAG: FixH family protein [Sulfuricellaceae bacterium]|jgi:nitrogen fixation protein FixH
MTLIETLFGGILGIAGLHFLLRFVKVGNYWRGVLSGVLPTVAYLVYASKQWPGGDVVAVHITVYLAAATVITIAGSNKQGGSGKLHWAPMLLIGFFVVLATLMASFVMISIRGLPTNVAQMLLPTKSDRPIHTAFSGVVPHNEEAAKTIAQHMSAQEKQRRLGWKVEVDGLEAASASRSVEVKVATRDGAPLQNAKVVISIQPLADAESRQDVELKEENPGAYRGQLNFARPGRWVVELHIQSGNDAYQVEQSVSVPKA